MKSTLGGGGGGGGRAAASLSLLVFDVNQQECVACIMATFTLLTLCPPRLLCRVFIYFHASLCPFFNIHYICSSSSSSLLLPLQHLIRLFRTPPHPPQSAGTLVPTSNINLADFSADDSALSFCLAASLSASPSITGRRRCEEARLWMLFLKFEGNSATCATC